MTDGRLSTDPRVSRYVVRTHRRGTPVLFDTVGLNVLPVHATEPELREAGMLAGQEQQSLWSRLIRPRRKLALTVVVTWECNLRCTHCSVRDKLRREDPEVIHPEMLKTFIRRYRTWQPDTDKLSLSLLGGEPLLRPQACAALVDAAASACEDVHRSMTTNLAPLLRDEHIEALTKLDEIVVSLDGLEDAHNTQRRPYRDSFDPFRRTMDNLQLLSEAGLVDRVVIQGAIRDDFASEEHFNRFHRMLVKVGVPYDQIRFDTVHPAERGLEVQQSYLQSLRYPLLRREPCCKFRGGSSLVIGSDGTIYSDFYTWERLGSLDDRPESIVAAQREITRRSMPALEDPGCRGCPVIGFCWGGCANGHLVVGDRPSAFCDQQALIDRVLQLAADGKLIDAEESRGAVETAAGDPRQTRGQAGG